jgi:pentatricopeptide repeat protein
MAPGSTQLISFSWNGKLARYVKAGQHEKMVELSRKYNQKGTTPSKRFTFVLVVNTCASLGALEEGRQAHEQRIQSGCEADVFAGCSLVDMYAKCGRSMEDAQRVFNKLPSHDMSFGVPYILGGCAMHGHSNKALKYFEQMCGKGVQPNDITFVCLLSACSHCRFDR